MRESDANTNRITKRYSHADWQSLVHTGRRTDNNTLRLE
jgi:hypothetical protein